ncbi:VanW family protein [bacterium]|nr:MAG: VanW family protein [bacterium]
MHNKQYLGIIVIAGVILFFPETAQGSPFTQAPVPTYESVTTFDATTQATISESLKSEWKGTFTLPVGSMIKYQSWPIEELIQNVYLKPGKVKPETRTYKYDPGKVYSWTKTIAVTVNSETKDPELVIKNGRATKFTPPAIGKQLDRYQSTLQILSNLELGNNKIDLTTKTTQPNKSLSDTNDLGIKELIGRGESKFNGSPANRRHNIKVGVSKMQGVIIKPGEEFSFNKYLGPVEADQGFLPELVIRADKGTVPELGGGLCQVSSTTFRAAMHAGLPITQRRNHSYAVQYYAPQGTDATIYPGVVDLKFTNDTGHSILVWPYFKNSDYLVFDFYGTYDGREVKLGTPTTYDRKSDGSMKATWTRSVTKNGETKTDKFASTYQPPALFHKKEEFVANPNSNITPATTTVPATTTGPATGTPPTTNTQ